LAGEGSRWESNWETGKTVWEMLEREEITVSRWFYVIVLTKVFAMQRVAQASVIET
jgi:hypothetical protein